jgi:hypothetical protein
MCDVSQSLFYHGLDSAAKRNHFDRSGTGARHIRNAHEVQRGILVPITLLSTHAHTHTHTLCYSNARQNRSASMAKRWTPCALGSFAFIMVAWRREIVGDEMIKLCKSFEVIFKVELRFLHS